jgi:endonuclease/exonuclease/phosphatase (EEP) superfamily protein YafD
MTRTAFLGILVIGILFLIAVEWIGERNLLTTFFLFVPGTIWLLPLAAFGAAAVCLWDGRLIVAVMLASAAYVWFVLDWEMSGPREGRGGRELVVMTFNRGQRAGSLQPFKNKHAPDLLALQEAGRHSRRYLAADGYAEFAHGEDAGEFTLLSKYPIKDKGLLSFEIAGRQHKVAAWFLVDFAGEDIVVYNVHLDTPRDQLKAFRRGAFLRGLWPVSTKARAYQVFWDRQIEVAGLLLEHIAAETRPTIVVGDFNTPDHGYIYRQFCRRLQDAHEEAGRGFGWTFPGVTRNPLSLFGPWLRIDYQFAGDAWRVLDCRTESGRESQHLAVVARFELGP